MFFHFIFRSVFITFELDEERERVSKLSLKVSHSFDEEVMRESDKNRMNFESLITTKMKFRDYIRGHNLRPVMFTCVLADVIRVIRSIVFGIQYYSRNLFTFKGKKKSVNRVLIKIDYIRFVYRTSSPERAYSLVNKTISDQRPAAFPYTPMDRRTKGKPENNNLIAIEF